jgi:hypothetical protein
MVLRLSMVREAEHGSPPDSLLRLMSDFRVTLLHVFQDNPKHFLLKP